MFTKICITCYLLFIYSCSNDPLNSENSNFIIDSTYTIARGGDPRGEYIPNTPFVFYFGELSDSLYQNSGNGHLKITGDTSDNGSFSYQAETKVAGTIGNFIYAISPGKDDITGSWKAENSKFIITVNSVVDTAAYSVIDGRFFLIYERFHSKPFNLLDTGQSGNTIWAFK